MQTCMMECSTVLSSDMAEEKKKKSEQSTDVPWATKWWLKVFHTQ